MQFKLRLFPCKPSALTVVIAGVEGEGLCAAERHVMLLLSLSEYLSMMANHLRHLVQHVELDSVCLKQLQRKVIWSGDSSWSDATVRRLNPNATLF